MRLECNETALNWARGDITIMHTTSTAYTYMVIFDSFVVILLAVAVS